jgi:hypothetical protein
MTVTPTAPHMDAQPNLKARPQRWLARAVGASAFACVCIATALLWGRYGEAVYVNGIMTAIMNCF